MEMKAQETEEWATDKGILRETPEKESKSFPRSPRCRGTLWETADGRRCRRRAAAAGEGDYLEEIPLLCLVRLPSPGEESYPCLITPSLPRLGNSCLR